MAAAAALTLAGCLGSDGGRQQKPRADGRQAVQVRYADCSAWRAAGSRERAGIVRAVKGFAGGPTGSPGGRGQTLPDRQAYRLFDGWCRRPFAKRFRLYKLYTRAAAFQQR